VLKKVLNVNIQFIPILEHIRKIASLSETVIFEVTEVRDKYICKSRHQKSGQNHNLFIAYKSFKNSKNQTFSKDGTK
jgi:hypothetical protein